MPRALLQGKQLQPFHSMEGGTMHRRQVLFGAVGLMLFAPAAFAAQIKDGDQVTLFDQKYNVKITDVAAGPFKNALKVTQAAITDDTGALVNNHKIDLSFSQGDTP